MKQKQFCYNILQVYAPCRNTTIYSCRDFVDFPQTVISMYSENGIYNVNTNKRMKTCVANFI